MQPNSTSLCNGDGECFEHSESGRNYIRMYECQYIKCKLKKCQRCYTYHPRWYLMIYEGSCRSCCMAKIN